MRAIRTKNTSPEVKVRKLLFAKGLRFRLHVRELPGSPDIVLPKYKVAIFVHGCFWHRHHCHLFKVPQTRSEFWLEKIGKNVTRDSRAKVELVAAGWRVLTLWECALKGKFRQSDESLQAHLVTWIKDRSDQCGEISNDNDLSL